MPSYWDQTVVYFNQRTHACVWVRVCMVENDKKCYKIIKNILFSSCFGNITLSGTLPLLGTLTHYCTLLYWTTDQHNNTSSMPIYNICYSIYYYAYHLILFLNCKIVDDLELDDNHSHLKHLRSNIKTLLLLICILYWALYFEGLLYWSLKECKQ